MSRLKAIIRHDTQTVSATPTVVTFSAWHNLKCLNTSEAGVTALYILLPQVSTLLWQMQKNGIKLINWVVQPKMKMMSSCHQK